MRWAQRLKRAFRIDVETGPQCVGSVKAISCTEDPPVIERTLAHLARSTGPSYDGNAGCLRPGLSACFTESQEISFRPRAIHARSGGARAG
jgi:hypothetical protein